MRGRIIIVHGPSSAGKSTVIHALREALSEPFCYYSVDLFTDSSFHPVSLYPQDRNIGEQTRQFMRGFHRSIVAFAEAGNDLIVEHVLEAQEFADDLVEVVKPFDAFLVAVTAKLDELERREKLRGNRSIGTAALFIKSVGFCKNDMVLDTTSGTTDAAAEIMIAWQNRLLA